MEWIREQGWGVGHDGAGERERRIGGQSVAWRGVAYEGTRLSDGARRPPKHTKSAPANIP